MTVVYRSFVVRAWGRGRQTVRVLVEEVQSGRRSELRGDRAARLVAEIDGSLLAERTAEATVAPSEGPGHRR
jgi:hypothetical protein